ncbi:MAG: class II aldolase/adducin family protein [Candidatus Marinimicrobia bacterium]|nr:class II aldolase/adducin family protein [Candidatus Neomarinimicrobiota bacterium]
MMTELQKRIEICNIGEKVHQQGFVAANDGNISYRLSKDVFLITPTNVSKGELDPDDLIKINGDRIEGEKKPSSEYRMHLEIYKHRSDINSIIHVHSPYATAFAMIGKGMEELIMPEVVVTLGKIPLVPYKTPSTQKFAKIVTEFASKWDALLLERHGVVTLGSDLRDAYYKLERTEHVFKVLSIARTIGDIKSLTSEEVSELLNAFSVPDRVRNQLTL